MSSATLTAWELMSITLAASITAASVLSLIMHYSQRWQPRPSIAILIEQPDLIQTESSLCEPFYLDVEDGAGEIVRDAETGQQFIVKSKIKIDDKISRDIDRIFNRNFRAQL